MHHHGKDIQNHICPHKKFLDQKSNRMIFEGFLMLLFKNIHVFKFYLPWLMIISQIYIFIYYTLKLAWLLIIFL